MFEVSIDGKKVKAEVSFYTATLYEEEFRKDLLQDFFGDVLKSSEQISIDEDSNIVNINFEKINWQAANRVLWASIKTANESAPSYHAWSKNTKGVNMWEVRDELAGEVADCFFRTELAEEEA